jgi:hypothetical protein
MMKPAETPNERAVIVSYLASKTGTDSQTLIGDMPFAAASIVKAGRPMGAVLYTNFRHYSVEMTAAGEPGWLTRADIRRAFYYPFVDLGAWTVLCLVKRTNAPSRELMRRLGFTEQGVIETGKGKPSDIILYSLTRDKCRWLHEGFRQPMKAAA